MPNIISSFDRFSEEFLSSELSASNSSRAEALKSYFSRGGVISVSKKGSGWPKLVYPSHVKVKSEIAAVETLKGRFARERKQWSKRFQAARVYHLKNNFIKVSEPVYWKHLAKMVSDPDYREDAKTVKLPAHLVADPRWKPMIKMFVTDMDYRKQLTETVQTSIVYKKEKKVARYANELQQFRMDVSSKKIKLLDDKISALDGQINTLKTIMSWSRE